jgi:hypothetical protein
VAADRSNDDAFVWVEDTEPMHPTIWTSPYARTEAEAAPRPVARYQVAENSGGSNMVANAGMALTWVDKWTCRLTRLSDGAGWRIRPEIDEAIVDALWVDDDEVWFITENAEIAPYSQYVPHGITRLRRDALGPPTLPSGL